MQSQIGNWIIGSRIASGSSSSVYHCTNEIINVRAALKHVPFPDQASRQRFRLEVEALVKLGKHPHLVQLLDFGIFEDETAGWFVMEYVPGRPLPTSMSESGVLRMLTQLGGALAHAHAHGIFHRDVKPDNILVTRDRGFVLLDFGIAVQINRTRLTRAGTIVGMVEYSPPEQCRHEDFSTEASALWDIYGLGQVAYELLEGQPATPQREGDTIASVLQFKSQMPALDPTGECSPDLAALIRQATDPDPHSRLGSMEVLAIRAASIAKGLGRSSRSSESSAAAPLLPVPLPSGDRPMDLRIWGVLLGTVFGLLVSVALLVVIAAGAQLAWMAVAQPETAHEPAAAGLAEVVESASEPEVVVMAQGPVDDGAAEPELVKVVEVFAARKSRERSRPIDARMVVRAAPTVDAGAPFTLQVTAQAPSPVRSLVLLSVDGTEVVTNRVMLDRESRAVATHTERWATPGEHEWSARLVVEGTDSDADRTNNQVRGTVVVRPTFTRIERAPGVKGRVELVATDGSRHPVSPVAFVKPGPYDLVLTFGAQSVRSGPVEVGRSPATVSCSVALICGLK